MKPCITFFFYFYHYQFGKSPFAFGPTVTPANGNVQHHLNGNGPEYHHHQHHHGEWPPAPTSLPSMGGVGGDMRGASPAKDSPGHSNRNSAASSDSGRGFSTGHIDVKVRVKEHFYLVRFVCEMPFTLSNLGVKVKFEYETDQIRSSTCSRVLSRSTTCSRIWIRSLTK